LSKQLDYINIMLLMDGLDAYASSVT